MPMVLMTELLRQLIYKLIVAGCLALTASFLVFLLMLTPLFANAVASALSVFSSLTLDGVDQSASDIVVLGGGLKKDNQGRITPNTYSISRADHAINLYRQQPGLIITSGVESPWLSDYLKTHIRQAVIISDNASMNTCENAVFTAKLLQYHELPNTVYLVTDRYHMARARRQFAKAGVATIPKPAPLSFELSWRQPKQNLLHSRRATYEIAALLRDIFAPQGNCRTKEQITIETISTPRRPPKLFS